MKKLLLSLAVLAASVLIAACSKGDRGITGTYEYHNGNTGTMRIRNVIEFSDNGSVYHSSQIGNTPEFNTKGCQLYYKLSGDDLVIYHGTTGWKSEVRNTPYLSGKYYGSYIVMEDLRYEKVR